MLTGAEERQMHIDALYQAHYRESTSDLLEQVNRSLRDQPLFERLGYPRRVDDMQAFQRLPILSKASVIAARPSDLIGSTVVIADALAHGGLRRVSSSGTRAQASVWATPEGGAFTPATNDIIMGVEHATLTKIATWTSPQCSGTNCLIDADGDVLPPTADIFAEPPAYFDAVKRRLGSLGRAFVMTNPVLVHELLRRTRRTGGRLDFDGALTFSYQRLSELQRRGIAAAIAAPLFQMYGATELAGSTVAISCRAGTLHVWESQAYVEVLDDDEQPTSGVGHVVVTVLSSSGTRLVRYDVGDLGRLSTSVCACGLPATRRLEIMGRRAAAWRRGDEWVSEATIDACLAAITTIDFATTTRTAHGLRVAVVPAIDTQVHADDVRRALASIEREPIDVVTSDRVTAEAGKYPLLRRWGS